MLYDRKWEDQGIFGITSLIAWLERQRPGDQYYYQSSCECLLAQYFREMGLADVRVSSCDVRWDLDDRRDLPKGWNEIALPKGWSLYSTFGAALSRARALV